MGICNTLWKQHFDIDVTIILDECRSLMLKPVVEVQYETLFELFLSISETNLARELLSSSPRDLLDTIPIYIETRILIFSFVLSREGLAADLARGLGMETDRILWQKAGNTGNTLVG